MRVKLAINGIENSSDDEAQRQLKNSFLSLSSIVQDQRSATIYTVAPGGRHQQMQQKLQSAAKAALHTAYEVSPGEQKAGEPSVDVAYLPDITKNTFEFGRHLRRFAKQESDDWYAIEKLLDDDCASDYLELIQDRMRVQRPENTPLQLQGSALGEVYMQSILRRASRQIPATFQVMEKSAPDAFPFRHGGQSLRFFTRHNCTPRKMAESATVELDALALVNGKEPYIFDATTSRVMAREKDVGTTLNRLRDFFQIAPKYVHVVIGTFKYDTVMQEGRSTMLVLPLRQAFQKLLSHLEQFPLNKMERHERCIDELLKTPLSVHRSRNGTLSSYNHLFSPLSRANVPHRDAGLVLDKQQ